MALVQPDRIMQCPICLETMTAPILQCQTGHSMCGICISSNFIDKCPTCRGPLSRTRNYQLEQLIEGVKSLKQPCYFANRGCKFILSTKDKESHERECKHRTFICEGKSFAHWKCNWSGPLTQVQLHFQEHHNGHSHMEYRTEAAMKINLENEFYDLQLISFFNGAQYFWYKHKIDVAKQKAYWTFQFIGPKKQAQSYYYEFEVHSGPVRKFKVTEICQNDSVDAEDIFRRENCVVISFQSIRNFLDEREELPFKFRIMTIKKPTGHSK